jgi:hypothetical protein
MTATVAAVGAAAVTQIAPRSGRNGRGRRLHQARRESDVSGSLTTLIILVTLLHVGVLIIMVMIRLWRDQPDAEAPESAPVRACAVCSEPATHLGYDGLDPDERRDPHTGRSYSIDTAHYQPLCATH